MDPLWPNVSRSVSSLERGWDYLGTVGIPIGSMYAIYANIWGILMGSMLPYIAYMDPMGYGTAS